MSDWLPRWHQFGGPIWLHLGLMLLLIGGGWWFASRMSAAWRRPLLLVAAFSLLEGSGLSAISLGVAFNVIWPCVIGHALVVVAYVVLWRAVEALSGMPSSTREQAVNAVLGVGVLLFLGLWRSDLIGARTVAWLCNAHVAFRATWLVGSFLLEQGQHRLGRVTQLLGLVTGVPLAAGFVLDLRAWWLAGPGDAMLIIPQGSAPVGYVTTLSAVAMNIMVVHQVFGRLLKALERLRQEGVAPVLHQRETLEQALREAARQRPAVAALSLHGLADCRRRWGAALSQAVQAELALLLRLQVRPGELLARGDDEVLLLGWSDTSEVQAATRLQQLRERVAADATLDPEGQGRLTLCVELARPVAGEDGVAATLDALIARCRQQAG